MGVELYATAGTAAFLQANGIESHELYWPNEPQAPQHARSARQRGAVDLVINIPKNSGEEELKNDYRIRRKAADFGIPLITNIQLAQRLVEALSKKGLGRAADQELAGVRAGVRPRGVVPSDPRLSTAPRTTRAKVA